MPPPKQSEIKEAVHWGGNHVAIDPWEAYAFKGINASQCCEHCRGQVGPACIAFTLTGAGKDTKCTLLSSRLPNDQPAKQSDQLADFTGFFIAGSQRMSCRYGIREDTDLVGLFTIH